MKQFLLTLSIFSLTVGVYAYDFKSGDLYYNIISNTEPYTVEVTSGTISYSGLITAVIPNAVTDNGRTYNVISIGDYAFYACTGLASVTIPTTVTSIGNKAFSSSPKLTSIAIPNSVINIGAGAFYGTPWFDNKPDGVVYINDVLYAWKGSMPKNTSVTIAYRTKSISGEAFYGCGNLTSVTIPTTVASIGGGAFLGCTGLTTVTIPEGVTSIGGGAFSECTGLASVTIPASVTSIGTNAFYHSGLASLAYNATNCSSASFVNFSSLRTVTIGNNVKQIPNNFISGCYNVTAIIIPASVTSIGNSAFYGCTGLASVTIPANVISIGKTAFSGTGLKSLVFNAVSCADFNYLPFENLTTLQSVTIGANVKQIPAQFISGCPNVTSITIPESVTSIGNSAFYGCTGLASVTIPANVISIGNSAFYGCTGLASVTIPANVISIGKTAFSGTGLKSLVFNAVSCADFNYLPFENLTTLQSVTIGANVKQIPAQFIFGCPNVTSITIPESVTSIGGGAFGECTGLTTLVYNAVDCSSSSIFYSLPALQSVTIGAGVKHIPEGFISGCPNFTSITIPESVTSIGGRAFSGTGLISLVFNAVSCADFTDYYYNNTPFQELTTLQSVEIGSNVKHIPQYFIYGCNHVPSVTIPEGVTSIGEGAFLGCTGLTTVTIPEGVTSIGGSAFWECTGLTTLVYNAVDCSSSSIFYRLPTLQSVTIGAGVKHIPEGFISGCPNFTSITIPESVTSIGDGAFTDSGLKSIDCYALMPPTLGNFNISYWDIAVRVPCNVVETYKTTSWKWFKNILGSSFSQFHLTIDSNNIEFGTAQISQLCDNMIEAIAQPNYHFVKWSDGDTDNPRIVNMTMDTTLMAIFEINTHNISVSVNDENMGQVIGGGTYVYNTQATIEAVPNDGYAFVRWNDLNTQNPRQVLVTSDVNYTATFMVVTAIKQTIESINLYVENGVVVIENDTNLPVAIYDVVGRLVASGSSLTQQFAVPNAGLYLVKVGNQTMKVLVP